MKTYRPIALTATPLILAFVLAGCADAGSAPVADHSGGVTSSLSPSAEVRGDSNAADSMFAAMMIPHHQQAVEMSDMILGKSGVDERVLDLAEQITDAQGPEIELMQSWLSGWGTAGSGDTHSMGHADGMMSDADMAALETADGADAARLYLQQMIVHHEGAIEMAQAELGDGINPDAIALAQAIVDAQTAEIAVMQDLLTRI